MSVCAAIAEITERETLPFSRWLPASQKQKNMKNKTKYEKVQKYCKNNQKDV